MNAVMSEVTPGNTPALIAAESVRPGALRRGTTPNERQPPFRRTMGNTTEDRAASSQEAHAGDLGRVELGMLTFSEFVNEVGADYVSLEVPSRRSGAAEPRAT